MANKTIGDMLDETSRYAEGQGLTPVEIGIWVQCDGGLWQVNGVEMINGCLTFSYVTLGEEDADEEYTMSDMYKQIHRLNGVNKGTKICSICDDPDGLADAQSAPVRTFKFQPAKGNIKDKAILAC